MTQIALKYITLTFFIYSCASKPETPSSKISFKSVEITYTDGWTKNFSIIVDSNKIYFSPQDWDRSFYGILPDSIFVAVDSAVFNIINNKVLHSKNNNCEDCSLVAIKIIANSDTIRITQSADPSQSIEEVVESLQTFIENGRHQSIKVTLHLETRSIVNPLPPDLNKINFTPPKQQKKKGR